MFVLDVLLNLFWSLDCKLVRYCNTEPVAQNNPWLLVEFVPPKKVKVRKFGKNIVTNFRRTFWSKIILQVLRGFGAFRKDQWNCYCDLQVSLHQMCVMLWANGNVTLKKGRFNCEFSCKTPSMFLYLLCVLLYFWRERNTGFRDQAFCLGKD